MKKAGFDVRETVYVQANMHAGGRHSPVEEVCWANGLAFADSLGHPNAIVGYAPLDRPKEAEAILDASCRYGEFNIKI